MKKALLSLMLATALSLGTTTVALAHDGGPKHEHFHQVHACIQKALEDRKARGAANHGVFTAAMQTAIAERQAAKKAALTLKGKEARQAAWHALLNTFRIARQKNLADLQVAKNASHATFEADVAACHAL